MSVNMKRLSFKYSTTLESVSMTTQSMVAVGWTELITRIFDPDQRELSRCERSTSNRQQIQSQSEENPPQGQFWRALLWTGSAPPGSSPADQHLVSVFYGVELQSLLVAVDLKLCPDHLHTDVGQNNELTRHCNSTNQVQFIQDEEPNIHRHIEDWRGPAGLTFRLV